MSDSQTAKPRRSVRAIVPQKIGSFAKGGSEEWEVPVWQMVRIMVQLEKNSSGKNTSLWRANQESWTELDQALTDAGEDDFDVFAQLMMNTQVALHLTDGIAKKTLNFTLDSLLMNMRRRVKALPKRSEERKDLEFEISELDKLRARVKPTEARPSSDRAYQPKRFGNNSGRGGANNG